MILCDVNVLLFAIMPSTPFHGQCRAALEEAAGSGGMLGTNASVMAGVVRIGSHPRICPSPCRPADIFDALERVAARFAFTRPIEPGPRHLSYFRSFVLSRGLSGSGVMDAWFAALAVEHDAEWWTCDKGFARFPGLRWRNLLEPRGA